MDDNRFDKLVDDATHAVVREIPGDILGDLSHKAQEALQIRINDVLSEALVNLKDMNTYF